MAFVFARLTDDEKMHRQFSRIRIGGHMLDLAPDDWAIDRDADEFLVWAYPEREPPYPEWYAFFSKGRVFPVLVTEDDEKNAISGKFTIKLAIHIDGPDGPPPSSAETEAIKNRLRAALGVYFWESKMALGQAHIFESIEIEN